MTDFVGRILKASANAIAGLVSAKDGQPQFPAGDELGRLWTRLVSGGAPVSLGNPLPVTPIGAGVVYSRWASAALEGSHVVAAIPGSLRDVYAKNASGGKLYLMVFDAAALPANGTKPGLSPLPVPADSFGWFDFADDALVCAAGIVVAFSTTDSTLTVAGALGFFSGRAG